MVCVDHDQMEQLKIAGRSSSPTGRSLMIEFYPCLGVENSCSHEYNVRDNLKDANLVVLHNQIRFDQNNFGTESIVKESRIISEPLNMVWNVQEEKEFKVYNYTSENEVDDLVAYQNASVSYDTA